MKLILSEEDRLLLLRANYLRSRRVSNLSFMLSKAIQNNDIDFLESDSFQNLSDLCIESIVLQDEYLSYLFDKYVGYRPKSYRLGYNYIVVLEEGRYGTEKIS